MPKTNPVEWAFTTGEVSPTIYGRGDLEKYAKGAQLVLNYIPIAHGGVQRRPGIKFVAEAACSTQTVVLRPFVFSPTQAYVLELSAQTARFYRNSALLSVTQTTPYLAADLYGLDFVQSGDELYALHASYPSRKFQRYSDTCWRFPLVNWAPPPTIEYGARPISDLAISATVPPGEDATFTAHNGDTFLAADRGREIHITAGANAGGRAGIKTVSSATSVIGTVCDRWAALSVTCNGSWRIMASPLTTITPSAKDPVGASITLTLGAAGWRGTTALADTDCGRFAHLHGGMVELTCIQSTTIANGIIRGELSATAAAQSGAWTLEESRWSSNFSFAETGDFYDGRFVLNAGSAFAMSKTDDYENHAIGVQDDDAVLFPINSKTVETIRWIVGGDQLQIGTVGGEWSAAGGQDATITPTNVRVKRQTRHGSSGVAPISAGDSATLFVTRGGREIREFVIPEVSVSGKYAAPDLLLLASHLTRDATIIDLAYQGAPDQRIWAVRSDGVLLECTYRREENVVAWSQHTTCGTFESVAVIPHPFGDRDQVWVSVALTVNGSPKRYVGYLDDCTFYYRYRVTDQCVTCEPGSAVSTVGGLNHLAGMTVDIQGDGAVYPRQTVPTCGILTSLSPTASKFEVGLPYTSTLTTLRPEIALGGNSSQFAYMKWTKLAVKVHETLGMSLGTDSCADLIPVNSTLGDVAPLVSGDVIVSQLGWNCATVTVQQTQPLPSTILTIGGVLEVEMR